MAELIKVKRKWLISPIVILLFLSFFVVGCGSNSTTATTPTAPTAPISSATPTPSAAVPAKPEYGGTLKFISAYSPAANVGWPLDVNTQSSWLINWMYAEPLVNVTKGGTIEPVLAESWKWSDDNLSLTFNLRKGVKFTDGTDFNAKAVKWMFDVNVKDKKAMAANWKSIEVVDDYTVKLNIIKFTNSIWNDLTSTYLCFVSPTAFEKNGLEWARNNPIGTGPFKLVSFERDKSAKFVKNPDYWQKGKPYLDGVEFNFIKDPITEANALRSGDGHVFVLAQPAQAKDLMDLKYNIIHSSVGTDIMIPDSTNANSPLAKQKVRQAIGVAIDKVALTKTLGFGDLKVPTNQIVGPDHKYYDKAFSGSEYDPAKAKQLLTDAGYPNGFETTITTFGDYKNQAMIAQEMLSKVGIKAKVDVVDNIKFWGLVREGWTGLIITGAPWDSNFAISYRQWFFPENKFYVSLNPPSDAKSLAEQALASNDKAKVDDFNKKLLKLIYDDNMVIPLGSGGISDIASPKVHDADLMFGADLVYSWRSADTWLSK